MSVERAFYTTGERNLVLALYRAGVRLYWCFQDNAYVVESRYIARFKVTGSTEDEALLSYGGIIQEPQNWRGVATEMLGEAASFKAILADPQFMDKASYLAWQRDMFSDADMLAEFQDEPEDQFPMSRLDEPMSFWIEIMHPIFAKAYEEPRELDPSREFTHSLTGAGGKTSLTRKTPAKIYPRVQTSVSLRTFHEFREHYKTCRIGSAMRRLNV